MGVFPAGWRVSEDERRYYESLPAEERHEWVDFWHRFKARYSEMADRLDEVTESCLKANVGMDLVFGSAMIAEGMRATARGDFDRAKELHESMREQ